MPPLDLAVAPGADAAARDVGVSAEDLRESMLSGLLFETPFLPASVAALRSDPARRARFVSTLGPLLPRLLASQPFRAAYAQRRASRIASAEVPKPLPPRTAAQIQAERLATFEKSVSDLEKQAGEPSLPRDVRDQLAQAAREQRKMLAEMRKNTRDAELAADMEKARFDEEQRSYPERVKARDAQLARLRAEWPEDVEELALRRLRAFLDLSASVDFGARLATRPGGRKVFVDPALEAKPPMWKLVFRAGKPTSDAARAVAQRWLDDLQRAGKKGR